MKSRFEFLALWGLLFLSLTVQVLGASGSPTRYFGMGSTLTVGVVFFIKAVSESRWPERTDEHTIGR
jgi:hypothetical protein